MAMRLGALHDALLNPGDSDKASAAAEEVAAYDARMHAIERDLNLLKWMMGTMIALLISFGLGSLWLTMSLKGDVADVRAVTQLLQQQLRPAAGR
jgi:hypothetical protein